MLNFNSDFFYSIRFRLLASLFLILGLSISVSMFGLWTFERDRYLNASRGEAMRAGQTIEKALRGAMLKNDQNEIRLAVEEIHAVVKPSVISILSYDSKVVISTDDSMVGKNLDRNREKSCLVCHTDISITPKDTAVFLETEFGPVLRNVIKIANGPECYGCHPPSQKNCGILVYDVLFADIIAMLRTILLRTAVTGLFFFVFLIVVFSYIIHRYVHRPISQLMEGFIHVGQGDFNYWVDVDTRGELQEMADQFNVMSHAIQRNFAELKKKNWETASLYSFVQQLSRAIEWNHLRRLITDLLSATFNASYAVVWLVKERQNRICGYEVSWRQSGELRYRHQDYDLDDQMNNLPCALEDGWRQWLRDGLAGPQLNAKGTLVFLPLSSKEVNLGMLCLRREADNPFTDSEKKLISAAVEQIGTALANARLYRMAITDSLTGIYTRRYCESSMRKLMERQAVDAAGEGFCVLMLDIDHFKAVNDTYGHQVGDEVLVQLAGLLRTSVRQEDVACRFGGEEFILLVSGGMSVGQETAQRLRKNVEEHPFVCSGGEPLKSTISIGVANHPLHGASADEVIKAADQALYQAKEQGRNRVVCAGEKPTA